MRCAAGGNEGHYHECGHVSSRHGLLRGNSAPPIERRFAVRPTVGQNLRRDQVERNHIWRAGRGVRFMPGLGGVSGRSG